MYRFTGETEYADYIERNLYNGFLAQQNKETGMPTYFLPFSAGARKKWGTKTRDFWCCHGTMVQAQTLYPSLCYYEAAEDKLVVGQYIPSAVVWGEGTEAVEISQAVDMKYYNAQAFFDEKDESQMSRWLLKFTIKGKKHFTLSLRVPQWLKSAPEVKINGESIESLDMVNGYLNIERDWAEDELTIYFPAGLHLESLPDMPELAAVLEGPIVLAALSDADRGLDIIDGELEQTLQPRYEHTYSVFPWQQSTYQTKGQAQNSKFVPLYDVTDEQYTVYHTTMAGK